MSKAEITRFMKTALNGTATIKIKIIQKDVHSDYSEELSLTQA